MSDVTIPEGFIKLTADNGSSVIVAARAVEMVRSSTRHENTWVKVGNGGAFVMQSQAEVLAALSQAIRSSP